ncbi:hypothetical protein DPEC_G00253860 [Dallia pectoralis]|uniref:Uncharacterized protein n=1 Tax=Dallia pectoralis TaxID=75939 RepID=A0ACC2FU90_DALPE|nr:hypothetical protein DPEC_G00253860 [Dallia pectoralis]
MIPFIGFDVPQRADRSPAWTSPPQTRARGWKRERERPCDMHDKRSAGRPLILMAIVTLANTSCRRQRYRTPLIWRTDERRARTTTNAAPTPTQHQRSRQVVG